MTASWHFDPWFTHLDKSTAARPTEGFYWHFPLFEFCSASPLVPISIIFFNFTFCIDGTVLVGSTGGGCAFTQDHDIGALGGLTKPSLVWEVPACVQSKDTCIKNATIHTLTCSWGLSRGEVEGKGEERMYTHCWWKFVVYECSVCFSNYFLFLLGVWLRLLSVCLQSSSATSENQTEWLHLTAPTSTSAGLEWPLAFFCLQISLNL